MELRSNSGHSTTRYRSFNQNRYSTKSLCSVHRLTEVSLMNNNLFRSARAVLLLAVMLGVSAPQLYAIDSSNRYFAYGVGQRSCEDYVKFREKKLDSLQQQYERY